MKKIWDIHGGIHPRENKHQSTGDKIDDIPLPSALVIPLDQHIGAMAQPRVDVGDKVLKGQCIAEAQGFVSANVHASSSGEVIAIENRAVAHPSGMETLCVVIRPDGNDQWTELKACDDPFSLDKTALLHKIRSAGIAGMGGAGFPTSVKLSTGPDRNIDTLILNGTECEPYITADDMLMREYAEEVVEGALLLAHILDQPEAIIIGIEDNKPEAIHAMEAAVAAKHREALRVVSFPTKYPSGGEKQLIQIVTGKEVASGELPADQGIVVQNVGSARAAYRAARWGEPLIERVTTVVGKTLQEERNIRVRIGTPIAHLLKHHGYTPSSTQDNSPSLIAQLLGSGETRLAKPQHRIIVGGPMMGFTIDTIDVPVVKTTNCILAPTEQELPLPSPAQACIRCGMCSEACPASLLPQQLYWYARAEEFDKLEAHNLFDCIECGACSYVCPSQIPLVQYYRASKGTIRHMAAEREKADRSRERFEHRKARLEKAEAEKEAKRLARKQAAEEAKKLAAQKKAAQAQQETGAQESTSPPSNSQASSGDDLVAAAVARAQAKAADPAQQKAKLERALSSAQSRLQRAQTAVTDNEDDAQASKLAARVKQAEQKANDAQRRLDEFLNLPQNLNFPQKPVPTPSTAPVATAPKTPTEADSTPEPSVKQSTKQPSAAEATIAKAQEKAAALASMSDAEKNAAQKIALMSRLDKAKQRLEKAEVENSEHIDAYRSSVEKLEKKLADLSETP